MTSLSFLQRFTRWVLAKRRGIFAFLLLWMALGVNALMRLPIEAYPDVTNPMAEVVATYPGQSAEEVERKVTLELEGALAGCPRLIKLQSTSVYGLALVSLTFEDDTDLNFLRTQVAERLASIHLPEGAEAELGPAASPVGQIYRYTLRGPLPVKDMRALQDWVIERRLRSVPGVADIVTFGGFQKQYQVRIDPEALGAYGVSVPDVFAALHAANRNGGGGYVQRGPQEFIVRGLGALEPKDIGEILVKSTPQGPVRVRDVASIVEGATPRRGVVGRGSEDEVVEGIVLLRRGENPSVVLDKLKQRINELQNTVLPPGVQIVPFYDRNTLVHAALGTVIHNLIEGALLVVLVLYLFLRSVRGALIVAITIPMSLLAAFIGLRMMHLPANLISLGAIDFGVLVEASVIVVEAGLYAIERVRRAAVARGDVKPGREEHDAALGDGTAGVARPVFMAIMIILITLAPIFSLERVEGRIFAPMAYSYVFALIGALLCAAFVVPAAERAILPVGYEDTEPHWLERARDVQEKIIKWLLARRVVALAIYIGLLVLGGVASQGIGSEFLPELREGGFYVTMIFPSGISLEETRKMTPELRKRVMQVAEVQDVLSHLGRPEDATQTEGPNNLELFIALKPEEEWKKGRSEAVIESDLRAALALPGVMANFSQPITDRVYETISGIIGQVVVKIHGADLKASEKTAEDYRRILSGIAGVRDLSTYQAGGVPQLQIELDRSRLARRGLSVDQVQDAVEIALGGKVATDVWEGERRFSVALKVPDAIRNDPDALGRIIVLDSPRTTLGDIAQVHVVEGRTAIMRTDFSRFVAIKFNVRGRDLVSVIEEAQAKTKGIQMPVGSYASWGGEFENQRRAMGRLSIAVPLALLVIIALLSWNFGGVLRPFLVMFTLPLGLVGAIVGLRISQLHFSVSAAIGCVALVGQLVLGSVLSLERVVEARAEGATGDDAIVKGFTRAFRPVLLSAALALFGLLPLSMSHGMGAETQRPFAVTILFGCLFAAPTLLLILPVLESYADQVQNALDRLLGGKKPAVAVTGLLLAIALVPTSARAQTASPTVAPAPVAQPALAERDVVDHTLRSNGFVLAAKKGIAIAQADVVGAKVYQNPSITFSVGYSPIGGDVNGEWLGTFQYAQPLYLFGQIGARTGVAEAGVGVARAEAEGEAFTRALDSRRKFVSVWQSQELKDGITTALADVAAIATIIDARAKAGFATGYDAMRIDLEKKLVEGDLHDADSDLSKAVIDLEATIGDPTFKVGRVAAPESLPANLPALDILIARAHAQRSELRVARSSEAMARASILRAKKDYRPVPTVFVGAQTSLVPTSVAFIGGLSMPLPVFDYGQGPIGHSTAEADARATWAVAMEKRVDAEVKSAREQVVKRREALEKFRAGIGSQAATLRKTAESAYSKGGLGVLELLDAYRSERDVKKREVQLRADVRSAELDLIAAVGGNPE
ncbi:MAG: CusA/CzcA family heavy metal efflux RND transporter [Polyangiales bacterium]